MKVGITGANGFIAKHLMRRLKEMKYSVVVISHLNFQDELKLKKFVENSNVIFHLAGVNRESDRSILEGNAVLTQILCEAIIKYNPSAMLVFSSSFQIYQGNTMYAIAKKFSEEIIKLYTQKNNLNSLIFRLSNVYGPGCKPFYNSIIATLLFCMRNNKVIDINGTGNQKIDFINVEDVIHAFEKCLHLEKKNNAQIIDICSGVTTSINDVIMLFNRYSPKKIKVNYIDSLQKNKEIIKNYKKAQEYLGWSPKISFREGIKKLVQAKYES